MTQQCVTGEVSYPFNATPGQTMTEVQWATAMKSILGTGIVKVTTTTSNPGGHKGKNAPTVTTVVHALAVAPTSPASMSVTVDTGEAWIFGHFYQNSIVQTFIIPPNLDPAAKTRVDMLVLDLNWGLDGGIQASG